MISKHIEPIKPTGPLSKSFHPSKRLNISFQSFYIHFQTPFSSNKRNQTNTSTNSLKPPSTPPTTTIKSTIPSQPPGRCAARRRTAASLHPGCLPAAVPPRGWNGFAWTHPVLRGPPGAGRYDWDDWNSDDLYLICLKETSEDLWF